MIARRDQSRAIRQHEIVESSRHPATQTAPGRTIDCKRGDQDISQHTPAHPCFSNPSPPTRRLSVSCAWPAANCGRSTAKMYRIPESKPSPTFRMTLKADLLSPMINKPRRNPQLESRQGREGRALDSPPSPRGALDEKHMQDWPAADPGFCGKCALTLLARMRTSRCHNCSKGAGSAVHGRMQMCRHGAGWSRDTCFPRSDEKAA
jgi:hypothetical protein